MAKTPEQCAAEIFTSVNNGLVSMAAQASARVSELEDELTWERQKSAVLQTKLNDAQRWIPVDITRQEDPAA